MIIYKRSDGTMQYGGVALEILDYTAKALNIRKVITTIHWSDANENINTIIISSLL